MISDAPAKAKLLNDYFSSEEGLSSVPHIKSLSIPAMEPISINPEGVKNLLNNLKANKVSVPNQISIPILKNIFK